MNTIDSSMVDKITAAVFFPRPDFPMMPEAEGAQDHLFEIEPGILSRIRLFLNEPSDPTILFFHGNGETARDYDMTAEMFRNIPASLAVAEYRGYGPSTGNPSLTNMLNDAHSILDEIRNVLSEKGHSGPLLVMGRSLGSAPALELANAHADKISALIIESGFANMIPLLELLGISATTFGITEADGPQNLKKMSNVSLPTLILHAELDQIIPIREAELLMDACGDPDATFVRVSFADHNNIQMMAGDSYYNNIGKLLERISG